MSEVNLLSLVKPHYFWSRVEVKNTKECWNWKGPVASHGYGDMQVNDGQRYRHLRAHRVSMHLFGNVIPEGMVVDHQCKNKLCVNPAHLRIVTSKTNSLENSVSVTARNNAKTHCIRGHEFNESNTYKLIGKSGRQCRECKSILDKKYKAQKKARELGV